MLKHCQHESISVSFTQLWDATGVYVLEKAAVVYCRDARVQAEK